MVRTIVGVVCVAAACVAAPAAGETGVGAGPNEAAVYARRAVGGVIAVPPSPVTTATQPRPASRRPAIRGMADARRVWLGAEHRGLLIQKAANRVDGSLAIELRYGQDAIAIGVDVNGRVTVARGNRRLAVTSAAAFEQVQRLLSGSEAAIATRLMLAERESVSDFDAGEMSLLSTAAFVASLLGDVDAPRRLAARFVDKQLGVRPAKVGNCYDTYTNEVSASWNDMQSCMDEANQDASVLNRAYRRVACNGVWLLRSEAAWIEFMGCLGPGQIFQ